MEQTDVNSEKGKGDMLRDGPCSKEFDALEACGKRLRLSRNIEKDRMEACPSETDILIKCIKKNPLFFHSKPASEAQK